MIIKNVDVLLKREEIESDEPIQIRLEIGDGVDFIEYIIDYPKGEGK